ncbi:hypothetical protein C8261_05165 [Pseudothauera lacus]|uniref:Uncharacterized protein n=1 Tax=Pseudothauera lacus TaxID=2136175 RepID=A0A2T4IHZ9_9RHOO|nr:hypothetical protein C8261_05165 [Pseudothauera lacus]
MLLVGDSEIDSLAIVADEAQAGILQGVGEALGLRGGKEADAVKGVVFAQGAIGQQGAEALVAACETLVHGVLADDHGNGFG